MIYELSILVPARNEEFLVRTLEDILENIEAETEIIVVLDGAWADPPIPQHDRVNVIYVPETIGQRAAINLACRLSKAKYVMKVDAHCSFRKGFDKSMIKAMKRAGDDVVMAPIMKNLHVYDWVCVSGHRQYQDKGSKCLICGKEMEKEMVWTPRKGINSTSFCFDSEPHFQYFNDYKSRQTGDLVETMSLQGSCFMLTRENYWKLNICDEAFGSWGSQGIEVACKFWLSGRRVLVNKRTWYAHTFRTKGANGFGFPYPNEESKIQEAKQKVRDVFFNNKWEQQIYPLSWLLEKFWPIRGWNEDDLNKVKQSEKSIL